MYKFSWIGDNDGLFTCDPEKEGSKTCSICGLRMNVEYNVYDAVDIVESSKKQKHLHDRFTCPNLKEEWHKEIARFRKNVKVHIVVINVFNTGESQGKCIVDCEEKVKKIFASVEKQP